MQTVIQDLRYAIRVLRRTPAFTIAALLTLTLGIGATTAIFSVLYGVVLDPLPFPDAKRLAFVWETDPHNDSYREGASLPDLRDWQAQQHSFERLSGYTRGTATITDAHAEAVRVDSAFVLWDLFATLGVQPAVGRSFTAADDVRNAAPVAIVSHTLWEQRFHGQPLGTTITIDGKPFRIIGVMPAFFDFPAGARVWTPLVATANEFSLLRGHHSIRPVGRLRSGVTARAAQNEMNVIMARLAAQYEDTAGRGARIESMHDVVVGDVAPRIVLLSAAVALVLLIACMNVAGLMIARANGRSRELAIRASLGATKRRVAMQLLAEALLIGLTGSILGIGVAAATTRILLGMIPDLPRAAGVGMRPAVLGFAVLAGLGSALIFGLAPAAGAAARGAFGDLRGRSRHRHRASARSILVAAEVAVAVVLLAGAALFLVSFSRLMSVDSGVDVDRVLTASIELPSATYPVPARKDYPNWPKAVAFDDELLRSLRAIPGVRDAALAMNHPFAAGWTTQIDVEGKPKQAAGATDEVRVRAVSPHYFELLGMRPVRGRTLDDRDRAGSPDVLVVNETLARRYFGSRDPVGKHISFWGHTREIVGVVRGERFQGLDQEPDAAMYPPIAQLPMSSLTVLLKTGADVRAFERPLRQAVQSIDRGVAVSDVEPVEHRLDVSTATPRVQTLLITLFGAMALVLAIIGLYGLIAFQVQQRTREIGIRVALGAQRGAIIRLVVRDGVLLGLYGVAAGTAGAVLASSLFQRSLFHVSANDPRVYAAVAAVLTLAAAIASWVPARRAASIQPSVALRYD